MHVRFEIERQFCAILNGSCKERASLVTVDTSIYMPIGLA